MTLRTLGRRWVAGTAVALLAAVLAACGSGDPAPATPTVGTAAAGTGAASAATEAASGASAVRVAAVGAIAGALTDASGKTLYTFTADDPTPGKSACSGACAAAWPPATAPGASVAKPEGAPGTLATIAREDGSRQLTYNGRPLYRFVSDQQAGEAKGQGVTSFGGTWAIATTQASAGAPARPAGTAAPVDSFGY